jgi:cytochrome c oxidase assembly protein subunit 15
MSTVHLGQLLLTALLVALLPLCWVWIAKDSNKYRKLVWVTLFLTFDLIVFGAFTRLTDSGLGCPDWPGCYAHANPLQALAQIDAAASHMPDGPVTRNKAWIEMIHRYLAGAIGVLLLALLFASLRFWRNYQRQSALSPALPTVLVLWVMVQGAFGAWTVTLKLQPVIVTLHLLLGLGLLALVARLAEQQDGGMPTRCVHAPGLRTLVGVTGLVLLCQLALGGWVSTNYAATACSEFPLCQGQWWPNMDFAHGFTLWRELGKTASGAYLPFAALTAIHVVHRLFAWLLALLLVAVSVRAWRTDMRLQGLARGLALVLLLQLATGLGTVFFAWPLLLAVLHNAGAALLVLLLTMLHYRVSHS